MNNEYIKLLDRFAAAALAGMSANQFYNGCPTDRLSGFAYEQACSMLEERKKWVNEKALMLGSEYLELQEKIEDTDQDWA
mgnify:CR=1